MPITAARLKALGILIAPPSSPMSFQNLPNYFPQCWLSPGFARRRAGRPKAAVLAKIIITADAELFTKRPPCRCAKCYCGIYANFYRVSRIERPPLVDAAREND